MTGLLKCMECPYEGWHSLSPAQMLQYNRVQGEKAAHLRQAEAIKTNEAKWSLSLERARPRVASMFRAVQRNMPGYKERPVQLDLAAHVEALLSKNGVLLAEAGVGTGKTLAYLVPLLNAAGLADGPVVLSTRTVNLMDQMSQKDFPVALKAHQGGPSWNRRSQNVSVIKGQSHYACLYRLHKAGSMHRRDWTAIKGWLDNSQFGARADSNLPVVVDEHWERIQINTCLQDACPYVDVCPYIRLREEVQQSQGFVITNHNLLAQNLVHMRNVWREYWQRPRAIVIDEAHAFEGAVRQQSSMTISQTRFDQVSSYLADYKETFTYNGEQFDADEIEYWSNHLSEIAWGARDERDRNEGVRFSLKMTPRIREVVAYLKGLTSAIAQQLDDRLAAEQWGRRQDFEDDWRIRRRQMQRAQGAAEQLARALSVFDDISKGEDSSFAAWVEKERDEIRLIVAPIQVGKFLEDMLWNQGVPIVLTSGTLVAHDGFKPLKTALGLDRHTQTHTFQRQSDFDYQNNVIIYVASDLPEPRSDFDDQEDETFTDALKPRLELLLKATDGRSLVLFTSYRRMHEVHKYLVERQLPFGILIQRPGRTYQILKEFRQDVRSVLLATGAFWEGVDVEGPALSQVIMDKLPFPNPMDPLVAAMSRQAGYEAVQRVYLPGMVTMLRQGAGRLIRDESDWGVISILDRRASTKYRRDVQSALPPSPWVQSVSDVADWFNRKSCLAHRTQ